MAAFVSTIFDIQTYLADLNESFGGLYAGLFLTILCIISYGTIIYAHNYHIWEDYHYYGVVNKNNLDDTEFDNDNNNKSDASINTDNVYSLI